VQCLYLPNLWEERGWLLRLSELGQRTYIDGVVWGVTSRLQREASLPPSSGSIGLGAAQRRSPERSIA